MKHFELLAAGVDVLPLRHAIQRQPDLWDRHPQRQQMPGSPHAQVRDILLRFQDFQHATDVVAIQSTLETVYFPAWYQLPQAHALVFDLARRVEACRLGRVMITSLPPGGKILPHADEGAYAEHFERYHIALQGLPGSTFRAGDETVTMLTGQCWWFRNTVEHEVVNASADDRIHLIVDLHV